MMNQEKGFRLDAKTLSRITGGAAVLFGMSQLGGDAPHSYSPETFSNRPSLNQTVDAAPWLGRNRMQETTAAHTTASRPTSSEMRQNTARPITVDWLTAGEVAGVSGLTLWGAADVVRGVVAGDRKKQVVGGAKILLATQLACGIGPEMSKLTQTPEAAAEVRFLDVSHTDAQKALQTWLDQSAPLPDGRVIKDMDGDQKIFAPIFDPPATVLSADGKSMGSVVLAEVEASNQGKPEYQTFLIMNDGTGISALATGNAHASADGKSVISNLVDVNQKVRAQQETGTDMSNPSIKIIINNVTYTLLPASQTQYKEFLSDAKFTSGSVEVSITPTAEASAPTPVPTETHVNLNVDADVLQQLKDQNALNPDGSVKTANKYVENNPDFSVSPESIKHITTTDTAFKEVLSGTDNQGQRMFWNEQKGYWFPEFGVSNDLLSPDKAPYVPLDAYFDGSAHYSAAVYILEHPGLIAKDASYPHYKVNLAVNGNGVIGYEISIVGMAERAIPDEPSTVINFKTPKPFNYFGIQQTKDSSGAIIYVVNKDNWNPSTENPDQTSPTFHGFDKDVYLQLLQYERFKMLISNQANMPGELVPLLPAPPGRYFSIPDFGYNTDLKSPHVAALADQSIFSIFSADIQAQINNMLDKAGQPLDAKTNPRHVVLPGFPSELSNYLLYTGTRDW